MIQINPDEDINEYYFPPTLKLKIESCNPTRTFQNSRVRVGSGLTNYEYVGFLSGLKIT